MKEPGGNFKKSKQLAAELASLDRRISQIAILDEITDDSTKLDLVCSFEPEPDDDATGYFWIANLLLRIDFEHLNDRLAIPFTYELGFQMGEEVFLPDGEILNKPKNQTVLWPGQDGVTLTPERPSQRRPYEIFGLTEKEAACLRVTDNRLKEIISSQDTSIHSIKMSTNTFGEFLFLTTSRGVGQQRIYMTFYGLGYHEYRERWIKEEWFWYQLQESMIDSSTKISEEEAIEKLEQRLADITPKLNEDTQTERGRMFEQIAELYDDDAALTLFR